MTDITDQDRRDARQWAEDIAETFKYDDETPRETRAAVNYILATVDAPAPTLEEGIREWVEKRYSGVIGTGKYELIALADSAEQMEHDLAEARAEVERLTVERDRLEAAQHLADGSAWGGPVREPTVQKGAESNAETPDPADVKPGEAWMVEVRGERRPAVKDRDSIGPWNTIDPDGRFLMEDNENVTLLHRLVPAPRVITNPDELDRLAASSVILSTDGDAWQKSSETSLWVSAWWATSDGEPSKWTADRLCDEDHPVTVLWEPEA